MSSKKLESIDIKAVLKKCLLLSLIVNCWFARDVTVAILVFQNNETAAMLVYQENPLGV